MNDPAKRLTRLTAILTQLQTRRIITATELANRFSVSVRTIYRDIKTLDEAGVPVTTEDGKGYSLLEGYRLPPVMFTESEANAIITAEQLIMKNKDASFVREFSEVSRKIRAVLQHSTRQKVNLLSERIVFRVNQDQEKTSNFLSELQLALTNHQLVEMRYHSPDQHETTVRTVEPFALYSTQENWLLIAKCRLRNDYRSFRLDRIQSLKVQNTTFPPHELSLPEYFEICRQKSLQNP